MGTHKADEDVADGKFHNHYKAIFVSFDIEDIVLIPHIIGCWKVSLDVRQVLPFCLFRNYQPGLLMCC